MIYFFSFLYTPTYLSRIPTVSFEIILVTMGICQNIAEGIPSPRRQTRDGATEQDANETRLDRGLSLSQAGPLGAKRLFLANSITTKPRPGAP